MKKALLLCLFLYSCNEQKPIAVNRATSFEQIGIKNPTPQEQSQAKETAHDYATSGRRGDGYVSLNNYNRIQAGMSYQRVTGILGSQGTELSSSEIEGTKTVMYQWKGRGTTNVNVTFQSNKLVSKALRWSRNGGQKKDVYFFCYGNQNQRGVAR